MQTCTSGSFSFSNVIMAYNNCVSFALSPFVPVESSIKTLPNYDNWSTKQVKRDLSSDGPLYEGYPS